MNRQPWGRRLRIALALATLAGYALVGSLSAASAAAFQYMKIVDSVTTVPGEQASVTYDFFGRPAINQSNVAYRAAYTDINNVLRHQVDRVTPANVIVPVQKANPAGPTLGITSDPTIYGTAVAYSALRNTAQNTGALYTFNNAIVTDGLINEQAPTIYNGQVVYPRRHITTGSNPNNIHIALTSNSASTSTILVDHNTLVPGGNGAFFAQYDAYLDHSINGVNTNGAVAYMGIWNNNINNLGIYRWDQATNTVTVIADVNTPIPGQAGNFTGAVLPYRTPISGFNNVVGNLFSFPQSAYSSSSMDVSSRASIYGKAVSFNYDDGPRAGIYQKITGPLTKIADINTLHPTVGGPFKEFFESSTVGSSVAFTATDATGIERGLFLAHCGMILQVAAAGDVIDNKGVNSVDLGHRGLSVKNGSKLQSGLELAFWVSFHNGTQAIYKASISQLCVSPAVVIGTGIGAGSTQRGTVFGSPSFDAPVFDDLTSRLQVQMTASAGGLVPAVFGGSADADVLGVDSLPGNNPALIDFVGGPGLPSGVVPESIVMSFNQPVRIDAVHLHDFDAGDSAILQIGSRQLAVSGAAFPDGVIPLASLPLVDGETLSLSWDAANSAGNGFSFGGLLMTPVPEPAAGVLFACSVLATATLRRLKPPAPPVDCCWGRVPR